MEYCGCDIVPRQLGGPQHDIPTPKKGDGAGRAKGWAVALRRWLAPNKAVHSWGDVNPGRRLSLSDGEKEAGDHAASSSGGEEGGQASFGSLPDHLLEGILANLTRSSRLTHFNVW